MFVGLLNRHGILKTDDMITKFIKMSTQMCVDLCYAALAEQNNAPTLVIIHYKNILVPHG